MPFFVTENDNNKEIKEAEGEERYAKGWNSWLSYEGDASDLGLFVFIGVNTVAALVGGKWTTPYWCWRWKFMN